MTEGMAVVSDVARELGGTVEAIHTSPDFRRVLLRRSTKAIVASLPMLRDECNV
jgi:hypothetical protein